MNKIQVTTNVIIDKLGNLIFEKSSVNAETKLTKVSYKNYQFLVPSKLEGKLFTFNHAKNDYILLLPEVPLDAKAVVKRSDFDYPIAQEYGAYKNLKTAHKNTVFGKEASFPGLNKLGYTIGLEYETAAGNIPYEYCTKDGLIPLKDGSITGIEYASVVMSLQNMPLIARQLQDLRTFTNYNKECSIHLNIGNYPRTPEFLYKVFMICKSLEYDFRNLLHAHTFSTHKFKNTGKNYCNLLPGAGSFEEMYEYYSMGVKYLGSLEQPHPADERGNKKWNIATRYYWVNFINALFYNKAKVVEFRNIPPTYSIEFLSMYIYMYTGIMKYAELMLQKPKDYKFPTYITEVLTTVFGEEIWRNHLAELFTKFSTYLSEAHIASDFSGHNLYIQEKYFK